MIRDLAMIAPVVIGSACLLAVCGVYLRSQRFGLDGGLLAVCGVLLLGLSYWQAGAEGDLARRLDALALLEGRVGELFDDRARLAAAPAADAPAEAADSAASSVRSAAADSPAAPEVLEIEALGGVSEDELTAIIAWIRQVHGTHRQARILVEPVLPLDSVDPDGQRRRLMNEAGRVIDHVFEELNQRVDISTLVSEPVPGPRLRLLLANV